MINFGEVLTRAWQIIWKHKVLWLFGLLASLATGGEGGTNFRFDMDMPGRQMPFGNFERFFERLPVWLPFAAFLLALIVVTVLIVLSTIGRAGLSRGAWRADSGEQNLTIGELFQEGKTYFWRVLLLGLLLWAISLAAVLLIAIPTIFTMGLALICLWPLFCLLLPLFYALTVLFNLSIIAVVNEDRGVLDALQRAWEIFRTHLAEVVVLAFVLFIGAAVVNFVIGLPIAVAVAPMIAAMIAGSETAIRGGMVFSIIIFLIYLPILLALRAVLVSYLDTAWTVAFRRLTGRTVEVLA